MVSSGIVNSSHPVRNAVVPLAIGVLSGMLCWTFLHKFHLAGADFNWPYHAARTLLAGGNPYQDTPAGTIPYPLPAAILALPFASLPPDLAAAMFFGISSALLALGLIRHSPERLLIFLAYPYWAALMTAQWTPLLMSAAFFPLALAFCIAKPQIGTPVALTSLSFKGLIAAAALIISSLIIRPQWPHEWLSQIHGYQHFIPFLVFPGPLLALALLRRSDRDARLLLFFCVLPQRWFYDSFILWLIPKSRRTILATVFFSWIVGIWRWYHVPISMQQVGRWTVLGFYLPMLIVVLFRPSRRQDQEATSST